MMPSMWEAGNYIEKRRPINIPHIRLIITLFLANILLYILLVWIWDATSIVNKPINFLDFAVKTPVNSEDWLIRRAHGV